MLFVSSLPVDMCCFNNKKSPVEKINEQAEAEVVPSSSLVEVEVEVKVGVKVEVGFEV